MPRDLTQELDQQAEQQTQNAMLPTWEPQSGETLVGTLCGYVTRTTKHGERQQAIIEREDGSGRIQVWLSATVLLAAWREQRPIRGERLAIRYGGRHPEKQYHLYGVVIDRDQQPADPLPAPARPRPAPRSAPGPVSRGPVDHDFSDPFADQ